MICWIYACDFVTEIILESSLLYMYKFPPLLNVEGFRDTSIW